jgi:hypothetical protein
MIKFIFAAVAALLLVGCADRVASNVNVLSTTDCGANWTLLDTGTGVPRHTGNRCGYNTAIPNWPMAGDTKFKTQFSRVLSDVSLSYTYTISNPLAFIEEARYLGKMGGSLELSAEGLGDRYEMAENLIIDKKLREITTELTQDKDVVTANPADLEELIFKRVNDVLEKKGVILSDLALVLEVDAQTRLAIDSVTALRVYESAGMADVGKQVIAARAGATQISINSGAPEPQKAQ